MVDCMFRYCPDRSEAAVGPAAIVSGAGGRSPSELCGRTVLSFLRKDSISTLASFTVWKISPFSSSSRSLPLKLSTDPFSHGLPGSMFSVFTPTFPSHSRATPAVNPAPLSLQMRRSTPRVAISAARRSSTSSLPSRRATSIDRHSRVNSSTPTSIRSGSPSCVRADTKSYAHT